MASLHFAQISDIHISRLGDHDDLLSGRSAGFLAGVVAQLNQLDDLDFVLFSGDLFDTAAEQELAQFQAAINGLQKPMLVIPGNHDRRDVDATTGLTRRAFAGLFNPQVAHRPSAAEAQAGYWSVAVSEQIQLIGLDSVVDGDWNGVIDAPQRAWLQTELARHAGKLVIVAVHHPLHPLAPIDKLPGWHKFVLDNGPEMLALLAEQPQVKLVLTGHHHLTKADWVDGRLHLACPALALYPCAYRTIRLTHSGAGGWQIEWHTHSAADGETMAEAEKVMLDSWQAAGLDAAFVAEHAWLALGGAFDQNGRAVL